MKKLLLTLLVAVPVSAAAQTPNMEVFTTYTSEQLVNTILLSDPCQQATNISSSTGTNYGSVNGIGYFQKNDAVFDFEDGIVLSTGNALSVPGPGLGSTSEGSEAWPGDAGLQSVLTSINIPGTCKNATVLEFDFVPLKDHISLDYVFASSEYGVYQCNFTDVMAFLLTDTATGTTINMAIVPGTITPVSVNTIRNTSYNPNCSSVNADYFGSFYPENPSAAPINFQGATIPLTAQSNVIPFTTYHLKLVIGDYNDTQFDSVIFIKAGGFDIGNLDAVEITSTNGDVICSGQSTTLSVDFNENYNYQWQYNGMAIDGATENQIAAEEPGVYDIIISAPGTTCTATSTITITEAPGVPEELTITDYIVFEENSDGFAAFDLTTVTAEIGAQLANPSNYTITYHETAINAQLNGGVIQSPYINAINPQVLYVRIENIEGGCFLVFNFSLFVNEFITAPTGANDQTFTEGSTLADIEVDGENIQWYDTPGEAIPLPIKPKNNETPLPLTTLLADGITYYASQTINGIESTDRLPVTAHLTMGVNDNEFTGLSYHPNPVKDVLTIISTGNIDTVTIYNLLGSTMLKKEINSNNAAIDLSTLQGGVYLMTITSGAKQKTQKIVKHLH